MNGENQKYRNRMGKTLAVAAKIIASGDAGCTIYELQEIIGANNRSSVKNVLEKLQEMGFAFHTENPHDSSRMTRYKTTPEAASRWRNSLVNSVFTSDEARFLGFVLESVSNSSPLMKICGEDFISKLTLAVNPAMKPKMGNKGQFFDADPGSFAILLDLLKAKENKTRCRIEYQSREAEAPKEREVWPVEVYLNDGGVYADCVRADGNVMTLSLQRIKSIKLMPGALPKMPAFKKRSTPDPFPFFAEKEPFTAKVRIAEWQAWYEKGKAWPGEASWEDQEDGTCVFTIRTAVAWGLKKWVLSLGAEAEILEPGWLRNEIGEEIRATMAKYGEEGK